MADHVVMLTLSDEVYDYMRRLAASSAQSVEVLIQQRLNEILPLPVLPADIEAELTALRLLSDDTLWTIAREQMPEKSKNEHRSY